MIPKQGMSWSYGSSALEEKIAFTVIVNTIGKGYAENYFATGHGKPPVFSLDRE